MDPVRRETRRRLRETSLSADFESIMSRCTLSDDDKQMLRLIYIEDKDLRYVGDALGYSEKAVKEHHRRALRKLSDAL